MVPSQIPCDFTLMCRGDSMTGAGISNGDIVCIKYQPTVSDGEIAAVLIGDGATLKRVKFTRDGMILWPENPDYSPLIFTGRDMEQIRIIGKATYVISKVENSNISS